MVSSAEALSPPDCCLASLWPEAEVPVVCCLLSRACGQAPQGRADPGILQAPWCHPMGRAEHSALGSLLRADWCGADTKGWFWWRWCGLSWQVRLLKKSTSFLWFVPCQFADHWEQGHSSC